MFTRTTSSGPDESGPWVNANGILRGRFSRREVLRTGGLLTAGAIGAPTLLAACGPSTASASTKDAALLRIVIGTDPGTMDPLLCFTNQGINAGFEVLQGLTTIYHTGNPSTIQPLLATSWTGSADALTWTFKLRQGVKFSDGTKFDAAAVKTNAERWINPSVAYPDYTNLQNIKSIAVIDQYTVQFKLVEPMGVFPETLATYQAVMVSPASMTANGNSLKHINNIVGTGPYLFTYYKPNQSVLVTRRESGYWGPLKPAYRQLLFKVVVNPATAEAQILSGDADLAFSTPPADAAQFMNRPGYKFWTGLSKVQVAVSINTQDKQQPLLQDVRVRQALNYAVDKKTIIKKLLYGLADEAINAIPPVDLECPPSTPYPYDPAKAKSLLAAAGASNMSLRMGALSGVFINDFNAATAIVGYLEAVGIQMKGQPTTQALAPYFAFYSVPPSKADWDLYYSGGSSDYPSGYEDIADFRSDAFPPNGSNGTYYVNSEVTNLAKAGAATSDFATTKHDWCTASAIVWEACPQIWLWYEKQYSVSNDKVKNIYTMPNGMIVFNAAQPA